MKIHLKARSSCQQALVANAIFKVVVTLKVKNVVHSKRQERQNTSTFVLLKQCAESLVRSMELPLVLNAGNQSLKERLQSHQTQLMLRNIWLNLKL